MAYSISLLYNERIMSGRIFRGEELDRALKSPPGGLAVRSSRGYGSDKALIFISHRQADSQTALAIAYALMEIADVDVYLDSFNPDLARAGSADAVTGVIDFGLNACTHLLAVISNKTRGSWWVPYEIGIAKFRPVPRALVLLEEVRELPEYLRLTDILKDKIEISSWAKNLPGSRVSKSISTLEIPGIPSIRSSNPTYTLR